MVVVGIRRSVTESADLNGRRAQLHKPGVHSFGEVTPSNRP